VPVQAPRLRTKRLCGIMAIACQQWPLMASFLMHKLLLITAAFCLQACAATPRADTLSYKVTNCVVPERGGHVQALA
jgi:hypothetical protein